MKRLLRCASILLLCGALVCPAAEARGRNERGRDNRHTTQPASRPGNSGRPSQGNQNQRPGNQNKRPGNQPRPDNHRPGHDYRPQLPPPSAHHPGPGRPMPPHNAWHRPVPPPKWHPSHNWRPFRSILGITFGSAINFSVNALINSGYTVCSYDNNSVYVNNVPMLNMLWPEAILFYNSPGGLCGSRFMYTTGYYDMNRYNSAYASLVSAYGPPVSMHNNGVGMEATWWGTGNQFIRLSFSQQFNGYGSLSYLTTLSFGI